MYLSLLFEVMGKWSVVVGFRNEMEMRCPKGKYEQVMCSMSSDSPHTTTISPSPAYTVLSFLNEVKPISFSDPAC